MPRIQPVDPQHASPAVAPLLDAIAKKVGFVPNFYRQAAVAPAVLKGFLAFADALAEGVLPAATREAIALAIAEANRCDYCLSAHSAVAEGGGLLDLAERNAARRFESADPARAAALRFARAVFDARGHVSDDALSAVRASGHGDDAVLEIVATVSINIYTNYLNDVAGVQVDFPPVRSGVPA